MCDASLRDHHSATLLTENVLLRRRTSYRHQHDTSCARRPNRSRQMICAAMVGIVYHVLCTQIHLLTSRLIVCEVFRWHQTIKRLQHLQYAFQQSILPFVRCVIQIEVGFAFLSEVCDFVVVVVSRSLIFVVAPPNFFFTTAFQRPIAMKRDSPARRFYSKDSLADRSPLRVVMVIVFNQQKRNLGRILTDVRKTHALRWGEKEEISKGRPRGFIEIF